MPRSFGVWPPGNQPWHRRTSRRARADAAASGAHSGSGGVGTKAVRVETERAGRGPDDAGNPNLAVCGGMKQAKAPSGAASPGTPELSHSPLIGRQTCRSRRSLDDVRGSRLLQTCHSYGVALSRSYSTGNSEEPNPATLLPAASKPKGCQRVAGGRRGLGGGDLRVMPSQMSCTPAGRARKTLPAPQQ
jgi:hypothetical protein